MQVIAMLPTQVKLLLVSQNQQNHNPQEQKQEKRHKVSKVAYGTCM